MIDSTARALSLSLGAYLPFAGPDLRYVYGLFGVIVAIGVVMAGFRVIAKLGEKRRVQQSSWATYNKLAGVKGLSKYETQVLGGILKRARTGRPSAVLGSLMQFEKLVDQAVDRGWIDDDELVHLEKARAKLVRTSRPWDGNNRRQYERAPCTFEVNLTGVTKEAIDEELKTSYDESDEKFIKAFDGLLAESRSESARVQDLSAGGVSLLSADKEQFQSGDYLAFSVADAGAPLDLSSIRGSILDVERMEEQRQAILHVRFLPYDPELRKDVIRVVYDESERAEAERRAKKGRPVTPVSSNPPTPAKKKAGKQKKASSKTKPPATE